MCFGATVDERTMISNNVNSIIYNVIMYNIKYNVNIPTCVSGCVSDVSAYRKAAWPSVAQCKGIREIFVCGIRKPGLEYSCRNPESH